MGPFGPELLSTRPWCFRVVLARPPSRCKKGPRPRLHPVVHSDLHSTRCPLVIADKYCIRPWVVFYNITSEYNSTFVFLVLCLQLSIFSNDIWHFTMQNELCARRPCFINHIFLTSDFRQIPRWSFLQFFTFLVHRCFCCKNFHGWRHKNKFVNQVVMF